MPTTARRCSSQNTPLLQRWYDKGLLLYKAMRKPKNHPASQQDIANLYANGDTWFGDKQVLCKPLP